MDSMGLVVGLVVTLACLLAPVVWNVVWSVYSTLTHAQKCSKESNVELQATPTTTAVMMGSGMQRRERDIVAEQNVVPLSNSLSTMRLPLDACSTAAADAIEATGLGPTVPATFDLVCSGGGLIAFCNCVRPRTQS